MDQSLKANRFNLHFDFQSLMNLVGTSTSQVPRMRDSPTTEAKKKVRIPQSDLNTSPISFRNMDDCKVNMRAPPSP